MEQQPQTTDNQLPFQFAKAPSASAHAPPQAVPSVPAQSQATNPYGQHRIPNFLGPGPKHIGVSFGDKRKFNLPPAPANPSKRPRNATLSDTDDDEPSLDTSAIARAAYSALGQAPPLRTDTPDLPQSSGIVRASQIPPSPATRKSRIDSSARQPLRKASLTVSRKSSVTPSIAASDETAARNQSGVTPTVQLIQIRDRGNETDRTSSRASSVVSERPRLLPPSSRPPSQRSITGPTMARPAVPRPPSALHAASVPQSITDSVSRLEQTNATQDAEIRHLKQRISELQAQVTKMRDERTSIAAKVKRSQQRMQEAHIELTTCRDGMRKATEGFHAVAKPEEISSFRDEIADLRHRCFSLLGGSEAETGEYVSDSMQNCWDTIREIKADQSMINHKQESSMVRLHEQLESYSGRLTEKLNQIQELEATLARERVEKSAVACDYATLKVTSEAHIERLKNTVSDLEALHRNDSHLYSQRADEIDALKRSLDEKLLLTPYMVKLQEEYDNLQLKIEDLQIQNVDLERHNSSLNASLLATENFTNNDRDAHSNEMSDLKLVLASNDIELQNLNIQIAHLETGRNAEQSAFDKRIGELQTDLSCARLALHDANEAMQSIKDDHLASETNNTRLSEQLRNVENEVSSLRSQLTQTTESHAVEVMSQNAQLHKLLTELGEARAEVKHHQSNSARLEEDISAKNITLQESESTRADLSRQLACLRLDHSENLQKLEQLQKDVEDNKAVSAMLISPSQEGRAVEHVREEMRAKLESAHATISDLQQEIEDLKAEARYAQNTAKEEKMRLEAEIGYASRSLNNAKDENARCSKEHTYELTQVITACRNDAISWSNQIEDLKKDYENRRLELVTAHNQIIAGHIENQQNLQASHATAISEMQARFTDLQQHHAQNIAQLERQIKTHLNEIEELESQVESTETAHNDSEVQIAALKEAIEATEEDMREMTRLKDEMKTLAEKRLVEIGDLKSRDLAEEIQDAIDMITKILESYETAPPRKQELITMITSLRALLNTKQSKISQLERNIRTIQSSQIKVTEVTAKSRNQRTIPQSSPSVQGTPAAASTTQFVTSASSSLSSLSSNSAKSDKKVTFSDLNGSVSEDEEEDVFLDTETEMLVVPVTKSRSSVTPSDSEFGPKKSRPNKGALAHKSTNKPNMPPPTQTRNRPATYGNRKRSQM